jgi:general secretion pathway protein G
MVRMSKGFTLVELLIVIVIIGILVSSILLSNYSVTASAEAMNIVSELRNLKTATMMFFVDSMDVVNAGGAKTAIDVTGSAKTLLGKYMDNPEKLTELYMFRTATIGNGMRWFIGYNLSNVTSEVKEKLEGKAKSTGLLAGNGTSTPTSLTDYFGKSDSSVWVIAR